MPTNTNFSAWREFAAAHPSTGEWPIHISPGTARSTGDGRDELSGHSHGAGIREIFGLDHKGSWEMAEDTYCFECGNTRDRSGELTIESDRGDLETIAEIEIDDGWRSMPSPTLVSAKRPTDSLLNVGWPGILNVGWTPSEVSIILGSWGERFGAVPLSASNSTLALVVARPPMTVDDARQVAREHFHFCPYDTQFHGFDGIAPYTRRLPGSHQWNFWWD
jgi:hypothetical protein